jgi:CheY-like chemotaxis protein
MDLRNLLQGLIELFRLRAADKGLSFDVELSPDLPRYIVSDGRKVRRILLNLLSNAVKFTASGGVTLRVRVVQESHDEAPPGLVLVCSVQDTGPGIAPEYHEVAFQPFVQPARPGHSQEGTGLGLPVSRQYAQLLGGSLTLTSTGVPGQGALLELRLPVALSAGAGGAAPAVPPRAIGLAPGQPDYRLVVDDQPENRLLLEIMLQQLGFAVRTAEDGLEALRLWEEWQPHLVWLDLHIPEPDGYEVARRIKATPQGRSTIIVALTASIREKDRARGLEAGCDDFLRKPFHQEDLVKALTRHLRVRFLQDNTAQKADFLPSLQLTAVRPPSRETLDVSGLPSDWVAAVRQAAIAADGARIVALAGEVRRTRPALAAALQTLAEEFAYQTVLAAMEEHLDG